MEGNGKTFPSLWQQLLWFFEDKGTKIEPAHCMFWNWHWSLSFDTLDPYQANLMLLSPRALHLTLPIYWLMLERLFSASARLLKVLKLSMVVSQKPCCCGEVATHMCTCLALRHWMTPWSPSTRLLVPSRSSFPSWVTESATLSWAKPNLPCLLVFPRKLWTSWPRLWPLLAPCQKKSMKWSMLFRCVAKSAMTCWNWMSPLSRRTMTLWRGGCQCMSSCRGSTRSSCRRFSLRCGRSAISFARNSKSIAQISCRSPRKSL